jgi:hypothetical protein
VFVQRPNLRTTDSGGCFFPNSFKLGVFIAPLDVLYEIHGSWDRFMDFVDLLIVNLRGFRRIWLGKVDLELFFLWI